MNESLYSFRTVTNADIPKLRNWLAQDHVRQWWGDPEEEIRIIGESLEHPKIAMWIVGLNGKEFAFIQDYDIQTWPQVYFAYLPVGSRAIDLFIGDTQMINAGHGSAFLHQFARRLVEVGAPLLAIDPEESNFRARRAYEKAGFHGSNVMEVGKEKVVLMIYPGQ